MTRGMPFEKLMTRVADLSMDDADVTMGELSQRWGEPIHRIMDAIDAVKVLSGELTYIEVRED